MGSRELVDGAAWHRSVGGGGLSTGLMYGVVSVD